MSLDSWKKRYRQLKMRRFIVPFSALVLNCVLIGGAISWGISAISWPEFFGLVFAGFLINLIFYSLWLARRKGGPKDPSLTPALIFVATAWLMAALYFLGSARGFFLPMLYLFFVFGILRLGFRQMLLFSVTSVLLYGLVLFASFRFQADEIDKRIELFQWLIMAVFVFVMVSMGGYINRLRTRLRDQNAHLDRAKSTIGKLTTKDELTGLMTRRVFMEELRRQRALAKRGGYPFCLCLIDVDGFRKINDALGLAKGDEILKECADCIKAEMRQTDMLGRYGGQEFVMVCPQTVMSGAMICAERIRKKIRESRLVVLEGEPLTVSIGVIQYQADLSVDRLMKRAESALKRAKSKGGNQTCVAPTTT